MIDDYGLIGGWSSGPRSVWVLIEWVKIGVGFDRVVCVVVEIGVGYGEVMRGGDGCGHSIMRLGGSWQRWVLIVHGFWWGLGWILILMEFWFWFFAMDFRWVLIFCNEFLMGWIPIGWTLVGFWILVGWTLDFGFRLVGVVVVWWWRDGWCLVIVGHVGLLLLCSSLLTVLVWFKMILGGGWYDYVCLAEVGGVTRKLDGGGGGGGRERERNKD